jgi:MFS family permease
MGGPLADFAGRRWGMFAGCFVTIIATFMQAFTPRHNIGVFIAGRVIIGIGQGLALTAAPVYIGEVTPASIRGKVMTIWQVRKKKPMTLVRKLAEMTRLTQCR